MTLPLFPDNVVELNSSLAVRKENEQVTYFNGMMPIFTHDEKDLQSFQMITSQFCANGIVKQADIARAFGVTELSVMRAVKRYRLLGPSGFYEKKKTRGAAVLTPSVIENAQILLDQEYGLPEIASKLDLKRDTLAKALRDGRLHKSKKKI